MSCEGIQLKPILKTSYKKQQFFNKKIRKPYRLMSSRYSCACDSSSSYSSMSPAGFPPTPLCSDTIITLSKAVFSKPTDNNAFCAFRTAVETRRMLSRLRNPFRAFPRCCKGGIPCPPVFSFLESQSNRSCYDCRYAAVTATLLPTP